jgi:predicted Zn finger-like uncharacterized protein
MAARQFWVKCPQCGGKYYAHMADFRGTGRSLRCPFCTTMFKEHEAAGVWDGGPKPAGWDEPIKKAAATAK